MLLTTGSQALDTSEPRKNHKMITGTIHLEDTWMTFKMSQGAAKADLTVSNNITGMERTIQVSSEQLGAIIGLAVCSTNEAVMKAAYPIAEAAFPTDWPSELRPMP